MVSDDGNAEYNLHGTQRTGDTGGGSFHKHIEQTGRNADNARQICEISIGLKHMENRRFTPFPPSTKPLITGISASKKNIDLLDEIDSMGLSRERALKADENGELQKVENWQDMKLTDQEKQEINNENENFFDVDHSKRRFDNNLPLK